MLNALNWITHFVLIRPPVPDAITRRSEAALCFRGPAGLSHRIVSGCAEHLAVALPLNGPLKRGLSLSFLELHNCKSPHPVSPAKAGVQCAFTRRSSRVPGFLLTQE